MEQKSFSVGVLDVMNDQWTYCCRCDRENVMVPQGPGKWQCVNCGLRITGERIERDLFGSDQELTADEVKRHIAYLTRLAERKVQYIMNPPPIPFRMKIIIWIARIFRVPLFRMPTMGGFHGKENKRA